ncbi:MAG: DUF2808 domain-containing protein [Oculatellaceae cyanobacterium Prado106]|jgi:hypothetical protein|nr:DUF2808 domain-containing protein [Oculatellaceae cyanobacterium Prado106]
MHSSLLRRSLLITLATLTLSSLPILIASPQLAEAVQLRDGRVYFVQPPRLLSLSTSENRASASTATYDLTLTIPEDAGEPLQRVVIEQRDGDSNLRNISFDPTDVEAFVGERGDRGEPIPLGETTFDRETQTLSVQFNPAVLPGTTVILRLEPRRNPRSEGVYLFGITAFPPGETAYGQFLGYGRLHFYSSGDPFPFF